VVHICELFNDSFAYFSMNFWFDLTTNLSSAFSGRIFTELLPVVIGGQEVNKQGRNLSTC
jgi:hypothetical protein